MKGKFELSYKNQAERLDIRISIDATNLISNIFSYNYKGKKLKHKQRKYIISEKDKEVMDKMKKIYEAYE